MTVRRYVALNRRAIQVLTPTHIELLAADGQIVKKLLRPKGGLGLVLPPTVGSDEGSAVTEGGEFERFCLQNPGAC